MRSNSLPNKSRRWSIVPSNWWTDCWKLAIDFGCRETGRDLECAENGDNKHAKCGRSILLSRIDAGAGCVQSIYKSGIRRVWCYEHKCSWFWSRIEREVKKLSIDFFGSDIQYEKAIHLQPAHSFSFHSKKPLIFCSDLEELKTISACFSQVWFYPLQGLIDDGVPQILRLIEKTDQAFSSFGLEDFQETTNGQTITFV